MILLHTIKHNFSILWYLVGEISHFVIDACHVKLIEASGLKNFAGSVLNTLRSRQNGRHFPDDIFKRIFFNQNFWISIKISLKFIPEVRINNILALIQIMAWRRPGAKPLSEPIMVSLLTHICVTRPQWVKNGSTTLWRIHILLTALFSLVIHANHVKKLFVSLMAMFPD